MRTSMSIAEARRWLPAIPERLSHSGRALRITRAGKLVLAILSWEDYDGLRETIDILSDQKLVASLRRGMREMKQGKTVPWKDVKRALGL